MAGWLFDTKIYFVLFQPLRLQQATLKVFVDLFQKVTESRGRPLVAVRRQRNTLYFKSAGGEQKQSGVTVFAWGTIAGGSPRDKYNGDNMKYKIYDKVILADGRTGTIIDKNENGYIIEFSQCDKTWERVELSEDKILSLKNNKTMKI